MTTSAPATVKVEGLKRLNRQLAEIDKGLTVEIKEINVAAATLIAEEARGRAPVVSGDLRKSIRVGATRTTASVRMGGPSVPYAPPIHWGWPAHNIKPNPFIYDAFDHRRTEVEVMYEQRVAALVAKHITREGPD